jgi:small subunit ribosomal protein S20
MPILANAQKALRQAKRRTLENRPVRSRVKTMVDAMKKTPSLEKLSQAFSAIDKAVKKHLIHKNKAARMKSQLNKLLTKVAPVAKAVEKTVEKAITKTVAKAKKAVKTAK